MEKKCKRLLLFIVVVPTAAFAVGGEFPFVEDPPDENTIDRISKNEVELARDFHANIEIILQEFGTDGVRDTKYWWGDASNQNGRPTAAEFVTHAAPASPRVRSEINPAGFVNMLLPDPTGMDLDIYTWTFRGHEIEGDVQMLVFDLKPKPGAGLGRFSGTVWVAAQDLQICRFDGGFDSQSQQKRSHYLHFVSVRNRVTLNNVSLWVPATVWIEERDFRTPTAAISGLKGRVNVFGIRRTATRQTYKGSLQPEDRDVPVEKSDASSLHDSRTFYERTEQKVLDFLEGIGVLAKRGRVDLVCEKVLYKLRGASAPDFPADLHCRVMLTSTVEWFVVGRTLIVSKSILDLPPDEPAMAALLAPALACILKDRPIQSISDAILQNRDQALRKLNFQNSAKDKTDYEREAITLLKNSEFAKKMATAAVFQQTAEKYCSALGALFAPRFGDRLSVCDPSSPLRQLDSMAVRNPRGPAALVLGARLTVDQFSDEVAMVDPPADNAPFQLVPIDLVPRLLRQVATAPQETPFPPVLPVSNGPATAPLKSGSVVQ
jgi:hypothetical protein